MNDMQRKQIKDLRAKGYGYGRISQILGISTNTIKTFCKRNGMGGVADNQTPDAAEMHFCLCCGIPVEQNSGRKEKKL